MNKIRLRIRYTLLFVVLLVLLALIALYVHDGFVRPYVGDMLVVILLYWFVRIFIPTGCRLLPLYVFLFAACVEGLQYIRLLERLGLEGNRLAHIVFGSVFDWKDVGCYGVGCLLLGSWEYGKAKHFFTR